MCIREWHLQNIVFSAIRVLRIFNLRKLIPDLVVLKVSGQEAEVIGERCNEVGIKELKITKPSSPTFHYKPPNNDSFGDQPLMSKDSRGFCEALVSLSNTSAESK